MTGLHLAAYFGIDDAVKVLLGAFHYACFKDSYDRTPLWWAAKHGHSGVVNLLLHKTTACVDWEDKFEKRSPLSVAAEGGYAETMKYLLELSKANVNTMSSEGRVPLSYAAGGGYQDSVKLLLGREDTKIDVEDNEGWTPFFYAAARGHVAIVELLLATNKVNQDARDEGGRTPLSYAAEEGNEEITKLLLSYANVDPDSQATRIYGRGRAGAYRAGRTPLSYAAENGHEGIVKLLLDTGRVDVRSKNSLDWTPMRFAEENGQSGIIRLLQATIDMCSPDNDIAMPPPPPPPPRPRILTRIRQQGSPSERESMVMSSMQLPSCISFKGGDIAKFAAQVSMP
jgi:ankyrin repeat protein